MNEVINKKIKKLNGTAGVIIKELNGNKEFMYNENIIFPAASIIKLTIIWDLFKKIESQELSLDNEIILKKQDKVGGFGILKELHNGLSLTIEDLITLMIIMSDNTATNILINNLGMRSINNEINRLNLKNTKLQRKMMDIEAKKRGNDNYTSPIDIYNLLKIFLTTNELNKKNKNKIINILMKQQCNNKLPKYLTENIDLAHKTGDLPNVEHDVGVMFIKNKKIIIVVLTKDLENNEKGVEFNNEIGEIVYKYYK